MPDRVDGPFAVTRGQVLVLGAAKSGTTSISRWLEDQDEVCFSVRKEPQFFPSEYERGVQHYWDSCFAPGYRGEAFVAEAQHRNLFLPFVPERIRETMPDPKLLCVLRDPVERAFAHWRHRSRRRTDRATFEQAIDDDLRRLAEGERFEGPDGPARWASTLGADPNRPWVSTSRTYVDSGYYADQIRRYHDVFGADALLVLFTEELRDDPDRVAERIAAHVGMGEWTGGVGRHNEGITQPVSPRAVDALRRLDDRLAGVGSGRLRKRLGRALLYRRSDAPELNPTTRRTLEGLFAPHNRALAALLDRPLPAGWVTEEP